MQLSDKLYNLLKKTAQVYLPAAATLYFAMAGIWHLPAAEQVVGSITTIDAVLGGLLHLSTSTYVASGAQFDGEIHITPQADGPTQLALQMKTEDPMTIMDKSQVTFKVNAPTPLPPFVPPTA